MAGTSTRSVAGADVLVRDDGDLLTAEVDGELVGLSVDRGACYGLNAVGTRVWALLAEPRTFDSLCRQLRREFAVDERRCREEVAELIGALRAEGLVTVTAGE